MEAINLPQEVLFEIFCRLPAKSVAKFRCLSKEWRDILSSPLFVKTHARRKTHQKNLFLITVPETLHAITSIQDGPDSKELAFGPHAWDHVAGSCHGLILLETIDTQLFLVNPITQDQVHIPNSPISSSRKGKFVWYGLGYNSSSDDYNVVAVMFKDFKKEFCVATYLDVYSVKWGRWKRVASAPHVHSGYKLASSRGVVLNGVIHWLAYSMTDHLSVLVGFDISEEILYEIPGPSDEWSAFSYKHFVVDGRICMMNDELRCSTTNFWVMKEYGVQESWTKFSFVTTIARGIEILCFLGDEEVLYLESGILKVYNLREGTLKDMVVDGVPGQLLHGCSFVDSFVSPVRVNSTRDMDSSSEVKND